MMQAAKNKPKVGRPRSEKSREAVLRAAHGLLGEGGAGPTIEAVARRAGVGKPTIYRWWPTLADIVLEALLEQAEQDIAVPDYTTLRETLGTFLRLSMESIVGGSVAHLRYLMAQAQQDDGFRERFRERFVAKRRAVLRSIFTTAQERGDLVSAHETDLLADMIFGAMWYRLLTGHAPMDAAFANALADAAQALAKS